jgi:uncharacterized RDD family membrane protein YckC
LQTQTDIVGGQIPTGQASRHAGFWARLAAAMVDFVILAVPFAVFVSFLSVAMGISVDFLQLHPGEPPSELLAKFGPRFLTLSLCFYVVSGWLYFALCESSKWHATPGKRLLGLYVGDTQGLPVRFSQASARFLFGRLMMHVPEVGAYYFLVDCLCVALPPSKRAIHDRLSGCVVLREARIGRSFS